MKFNCHLSVFNGVVLVRFSIASIQLFGDTEEYIVGVVFRLRASQPIQSIMLDFMLLKKPVRVVGIRIIDIPLVFQFSIIFIHNWSVLFA
ncbi:MAG: hypothetical protein LBQ24_07590 [Candidatus Peribacteria bacterium]|nr:hypothetical protein [Candidatus Peribacteria bacterium]